MAHTMIGGSGRPMRTCIGCGQTDDHPRCVEWRDEDITWHHDCHQIAIGNAGCHAELADGASVGVGGDMLQAILAHGATNAKEG